MIGKQYRDNSWQKFGMFQGLFKVIDTLAVAAGLTAVDIVLCIKLLPIDLNKSIWTPQKF